MNRIYKVTGTKVTKSKNGYTIFNFEFNNEVWASQLAPVHKSEKKYNKIYQILEKEKTLDSLLGKFISTSLVETSYGVNFENIISYDSIEDFKKLLDESEKKAFTTEIPMYIFLKGKGYSLNADNSITLKSQYSYFNIIEKNSKTICYPNSLRSDELTFDNIHKIYENFYYKKCSEDSLDADCKYILTDTSIIKEWWRYHKTKGGITRSGRRDILRIGDKLSDEHITFLSAEYQNYIVLRKWAIKNKITYHYFSNEDVHIGFPDNFEKLLTVTKLELSDPWTLDPDPIGINVETTIPKEIGSLEHLIELRLLLQGVNTLPSEISNLTNLKVLSLEHSSYSELPNSFCSLVNLTSLTIHECPNLTLSEEQVSWVKVLRKKGCELWIDEIIFNNSKEVKIKNNFMSNKFNGLLIDINNVKCIRIDQTKLYLMTNYTGDFLIYEYTNDTEAKEDKIHFDGIIKNKDCKVILLSEEYALQGYSEHTSEYKELQMGFDLEN